MADEYLPTSSSSFEPNSPGDIATDENLIKSQPKKLKLNEESETLEERLNSILCCVVCLDLPKSAAFQCRNGHLMCSQCFNHLLADAQLRMSQSVCPTCRVIISRDSCVRNLVVEKAISELPFKCKNCMLEFPRGHLEEHEKEICLERNIRCSFYRIGCPWAGPFKKKSEHERRCAQPKKNGSEIIKTIPHLIPRIASNTDYLSFEKIQYNDLKLVGPYHTDGYYIRFETFRFDTFGMSWEVRAYVNNNEADPTLSSERKLSYQLLLKESVDRTIHIHYLIVNSPFSEMKLRPRMEEFKFSNKFPESHFAALNLEDSIECYRLLSGTITFRLIMFWDDSTFPEDP